MHIDVRDFLQADVGFRRDYDITSEPLDFDDLDLDSPVSGSFSLTRSEAGILVAGQADASLVLECHRCLNAYSHAARIYFAAEYAEAPIEEQLPIVNHKIDLAPLIRQELIVALPIKQVCEPDCPGLCDQCGERNTPGHAHDPGVVANQIKIIKAKKGSR